MLTALLLRLALAQADTAPVSALRTTRPITLYVSPAGNDGRTCRLASRPCRNPGVAIRKIPRGVDHPVLVSLGAGVYDAGLGEIADHDFGAADPQFPGQIVVDCELRDAVLDGGTASGTFTTATNGSGATWGTFEDTGQSWVPSAMVDGGTVGGSGVLARGFWLQLSSGPGSDGGMLLPILDNTATTLFVPGQFPIAATTATTYALKEPGVIIGGTVPMAAVTPGGETGTNTRVVRAAQLVVRNNRSGYDSTLTSGATDGGSWAPIIIRHCYFHGDAAATMAGIATDGPLALVEDRVTGYGTNGRFILPTSSRSEVVVVRSSFDVPSSRVMTFSTGGTEMTRAWFEQNLVMAADYWVFGSYFPAGLISHNNLFGRLSTVVYRGSLFNDGYSFGDRVISAQSFLRVPGGSPGAVGGSGIFNADGLNGTFTLAAFNPSGRVRVNVDAANGIYGAAASTLNIASGGRLATLNAGADLRWRHGTTVITEDPASSSLATTITFADTTSGISLAQIDNGTPHYQCSVRGVSCVGWENDGPPYQAVIAFTPGVSPPNSFAWAIEGVDTTLSSGVTAFGFATPFADTPYCSLNGTDGGSPSYVATDGGLLITGAGSETTTHIRGFCAGPR